MKFRWLAISLIILLVTSINFFSCSEHNSKKAEGVKNQFVGSNACQSCHTEAYTNWEGSHHDWAMKKASTESVLGNFDNVRFAGDGVTYQFSREGESYMVSSTEIDGTTISYEVAFTFGVTPLQQYLIKFPNGKYQVLRASWDSIEKKWFHQYSGDTIASNDWLHWTQGGQRWNTMCAECHSTNLKKNYDVKNDVFNTSYDEINVGCESCHGPGSKHIRWANDGEIGSNQIIQSGTNQKNQIDACGGCHARRVKLSQVMKPHLGFENQFLLQNVSSDYYHKDGQILEEDYVLGSFTQSKMFHNDVKCSDCHNSHSLTLKFDGNALCMQCHGDKLKYDSKEHHFHAENTEGALCVNCHMTGDIYMGNDFRRDHSFRIPRPDQSVTYQTPNACTGCHEDKSDQWAADWVVQWYGPTRQENHTDKLLLISKEEISDSQYKELLDFISDFRQPAISRSTVLEALPMYYNDLDISAILKCLKDSSPIVRYYALNKFSEFPLQQRQSIALKHMTDTSKIVRIAAARLIIETKVDEYDVKDREVIRNTMKEYEEMLFSNADFPLGRLQLGDYYLKQNMTSMAIKEYEKAIEMDYSLTPVYSNLATAYNIIGNNEKSLSTLNRLIELEPNYDRAYYLRGLLYYEMGDLKSSELDLIYALKLDPSNERYKKNLDLVSQELKH